MPVTGLDSYGALPTTVLDGHDFIGRYVAEQPGKCIVASEVAEYHKAGKSLILVYEDAADDGLGGANAGAAKAHIALPILKAIGWPANLPVYFAFDCPGYQQDLPDFLACAVAFAKGINRPVAMYGDVDTCTYGHNHGVEFLWQFGEGRAPGITVYQSPPTTLDGYAVDPDEALVANYGQWSPDPPAPKPTEEDVLLIVKNPNNGGSAILNLADGTYYGFDSPDMEQFYTDNGAKVAARQPTKAEWSHFKQAGTI